MIQLLKNKVLVLVFILGLLLVFYSWYVSYPISTDSFSDFLFDHISPFYWVGLIMVFASLYLIATFSKRNSIKWIAVVSLIIFMNSTVFFYWSIPGSDAQYFRGLTEYFAETGDLDPSTAYHSYFQWPLFFS